jgi:hypothetical protein
MNLSNKCRLDIERPEVYDETSTHVGAFNEPSEMELLLKSNANVLQLERYVKQFGIGLVQASELLNAE